MQRYICVHGHFYQPPRENPWLEEVELQESASPFHDWNERISAECYGPNTASRILDQDRRIVDIVNNYSKISFNFGPTLLSWMEKHQPDIHDQIVEADALSREHFSGHGAAMAQVYNHMIMPLASTRDKYTQVIWGIEDFRHRFNRFPEGMWLPETAVNTESLEILAELGIVFTILSPYQAKRVKPLNEEDWEEVSGGNIDPTRAYLCRLPSGRSINLFFYDGFISQDIAFGGLLESGEDFAARLNNAFSAERDWSQLVHVATDGETYGHHHRLGDMALAYCLYHLEQKELARITIYGEYLELHPPKWEAQIAENSSWSCAHGVERWRDDCGCHSGMRPRWNQAWRKPLRQAVDFLSTSLDPLFEKEAGRFLRRPWQARDEYIQILLDRSPESMESFLSVHGKGPLIHDEKRKALKLLEMQRHTMLSSTSCGWFFDEISGIETTQVMRYAARALQLAGDCLGKDFEQDFLVFLDQAGSNLPRFRSGREVYQAFVKPASLDFLFIGSHYALSSLFEKELEDIHIYCYRAENLSYQSDQVGQLKLAVGRTRIVSEITWDETQVSFAAVYLGDHNANCGISEYMSDEAFDLMHREIKPVFELGDIPEIIRTMDKHFEDHSYTLWHLFKDEQQKVVKEILRSSLQEMLTAYRQIVDHHSHFLNFLTEIRAPLPIPLKVAAEVVINADLIDIFEQDLPDCEALERLIDDQLKKWDIEPEKAELGYKASWKINSLMEQLRREPDNGELLKLIKELLEITASLQLDLNLWKAQNSFFFLAQEQYPLQSDKAGHEDEQASRWLDLFQSLSEHLRISID
ncbi:MAG: DUF3536 domain-containing protein [Thermodesulfobacteriota bacterium]